MSQADPRRVVCGSCRANNFPGTARCWQCGQLLPPVTAGPPPAPARAPYRPAPARPRWIVAAILAALLVGLAAGVWLGARGVRPSRLDGPAAGLQDLEQRAERMRAQGPPPVSDPSVLDPDSETARARRQIEELEKRYNLGPR